MKRSRLKPGKPPQRKKLLARSNKPLKRTRMPKTSNKAKERKRATAKLLYCDSFGVPFAEANRVALSIPFTMRDDKRPEVLRFMHQQSGHESVFGVTSRERATFGKCWLSGEQTTLTAHHVVSRWDFAGNILMCCWREHDRIQHDPNCLPEVLWALWKHNPFTSWIHLIRARRSAFPFTDLD